MVHPTRQGNQTMTDQTNTPAPTTNAVEDALEGTTYHEDLVREYAMIENRIGPDIARLAEIKKCFRDLTYGPHDFAGLKVSVGKNFRLDPETFSAKYPVMQYPHLYKSAPDSAAIKAELSPKEIEALSKEGEKRITVK